MKRLVTFLALFTIALAAYASPPNTESLDELFTIMKVDRMSEVALSTLEGVMRKSMMEESRRQNITPDQQNYIDTALTKFMVVMREEISWSKMRPLSIQIYQETFTQDEVDGFIAFYKTPAGKALIEKMPIVMQKSMSLTQARLGPIMQEMKKEIDQSIAEAKSLKQ